MANEERVAILRMVADGKITVEQGAELLDALEPPPPPPPPPRQPDRGLGQLIEEALAIGGLGRRIGETWSDFGSPRPPRPPRPARPARPPRPKRPLRPEQRVAGAFYASPGRQSLSFENLVELKTQGVPKQYIEEMRSIFPDLGLGELLECKESDVEPDYARRMVAIFGDVEASQLVEMREAGVTVEFASGLRAEFGDVDPSAVVEAAEEGVGVEDLDFFVGQGDRHDEGGEGDEPDDEVGDWAGPASE
jgi:hypothetical protein